MVRLPSLEESLNIAQQRVADMDLNHLRQAGIYRTPFEYYLVGNYPPMKAMAAITAAEAFARGDQAAKRVRSRALL